MGTVTFDSSGSLSVVLVAPWSVGFHRNLLVGTSDDRIVWLKRVVGAERDHKPDVLIGSHPDNLGALLDAKELVGFGIRTLDLAGEPFSEPKNGGYCN